MLKNGKMKCTVCGLLILNRSAYLVHVSECHKGTIEDTDSSVADDSDEDPWWYPGTDISDCESEATSLTSEQENVAREVEKVLEEGDLTDTRPRQDHDFFFCTPVTGGVPVPLHNGNQPHNENKHVLKSCDTNVENIKAYESMHSGGDDLLLGQSCMAISSQRASVISPLETSQNVIQLSDAEQFNSKENVSVITTGENCCILPGHCQLGIGHLQDPAASSTENNHVILQCSDSGLSNNKCIETTTKCSTTKKYYCVFCSTLVGHFARHLLNNHKDENEILEILSMKPKDKRRQKMIADIRGRGSLIYNTDYNLNKGNLILSRNTKKTMNEKCIKPCPKCKNYYRKVYLYRHYRNCTGVQKVPRDLQNISNNILIQSCNQGLSENLTTIVSGMKNDDVREYILKDNSILEYGEYLCTRHQLDKHLKNMIRTKLRQVAKVTLELMKLDPTITCLQDGLAPIHYDTFLKSVQSVAGFDGSTYKSPTLVGEIGRSMKLIANRLVIKCIKTNSDLKKRDLENWLVVYENDYYHHIGKAALRTIQRNKFGKVQLLPLTQDILKLNDHIRDTKARAEAILAEQFDKEAYTALNKCLIAEIQIFNRRRAIEVEMMLMSDFRNRHNIQKGTPAYENLTPSEKIICSRYMRVEARGKLHMKPAAMLLNLNQVAQINLLLKYRCEAGVPNSNPYLFAYKAKFFKACRSLRDLAFDSDAERPDLLLGTLLRKDVATAVQALNFTENDMTNLATFMSHDITTHRKFYRIPTEATHLAKLSRLLEALDNGTISKFQGKSLDEIDINIVLTASSENDEDNIEDMDDGTPQVQSDLFENLTNTQLSDNENIPTSVSTTNVVITNDFSQEPPRKKKFKEGESTPPKKKITRSKCSWTTPERHLARRLFNRYINPNMTDLPTPIECRDAIRKHKELRGRSVGQLKGWIFSERRRLIRQNNI